MTKCKKRDMMLLEIENVWGEQLFNTHLLVDFSHATFSPKNVALGF